MIPPNVHSSSSLLGSTSGPTASPSLVPHAAGEMPGEMGAMLDDLSPMLPGERHCASPPGRMNLFQQDTIGVGNGGPLSKHSHTEQVMMVSQSLSD